MLTAGRRCRRPQAPSSIPDLDVIAYFPDEPPPRWPSPVLALGNFDGLHRGHMKIVDRVRRRAGERAARRRR